VDLEYVTLIFLVTVFLAAEAYRMVRGKRGVVLAVAAEKPGEAALVGINALILLENGSQIEAQIPACTVCIGRLGVGTQVRVTQSEWGYLVDIPWCRKRM
jgi:hypothetical protein